MTGFWLIPKPAISCIEKFLCVFVRFCAFWPICPFLPALYTSSGTTGDKNSQESLEIIIYIQTASHKNFSMWWPLELSIPTVQTLSDFEDSRPILWVFKSVPSQQVTCISLAAISCIEKFLCVFAQFGGFGRSCPFCTLPRAPLGTKTARKVWKL